VHSVECRIQHPDRFHFVFCQSPKKNTRGGINISSAASIKAGGSQEICSFPRLNRGYIPRSVAKNDAVFTQENSSINARNRETADFLPRNSRPFCCSKILSVAESAAFGHFSTRNSLRFFALMTSTPNETPQKSECNKTVRHYTTTLNH
jgi:hypothetical protein